jgi:hypothetical protein
LPGAARISATAIINIDDTSATVSETKFAKNDKTQKKKNPRSKSRVFLYLSG